MRDKKRNKKPEVIRLFIFLYQRRNCTAIIIHDWPIVRNIANQLIFSYDIYANLSAFAQYSGKICMKD